MSEFLRESDVRMEVKYRACVCVCGGGDKVEGRGV